MEISEEKPKNLWKYDHSKYQVKEIDKLIRFLVAIILFN